MAAPPPPTLPLQSFHPSPPRSCLGLRANDWVYLLFMTMGVVVAALREHHQEPRIQYEEFGEEFVDMLDGIISFVLLDTRQKSFVAAHDAVAICPLYMGWCLDETPVAIHFCRTLKKGNILGNIVDLNNWNLDEIEAARMAAINKEIKRVLTEVLSKFTLLNPSKRCKVIPDWLASYPFFITYRIDYLKAGQKVHEESERLRACDSRNMSRLQ
ncbi:Asparagine synthetase [glutamine-hydrolyzing] [Zea mays]|uniref:Asparagine synthetase [glutamine-hydrolyzing] n=1 Tax=Zea mays TaxID=4577 RepID=A0A3L6DLI1_MAIZE|nr:Asparagine synthetase [glutamine-hydrolyzing] [Zea mays]